MLRRVHPIAGGVAFLTMLTFLTSTVGSELSGSVENIVAVKRAIPWGFLILVPALAMTGASGFRVAAGASDPLILRKKRRSPLIVGNGILILSPAASYLATLASRHQFDGAFYSVQGVELIFGAINLALMSLNIRDGLRLTGRLSGVQRAA